MPRSLQLTVPAESTERLRDALANAPGTIGLRVQRGASVKPPGDVLTLEVLDAHLPGVMRIVVDHGIGVDQGTSILTSEPLSAVSPSDLGSLVRDTNEASLEEIEQVMARAAHPTANVLALMAISGALAVIGISENALHLVIAGMLIAPGFAPIVRAVFGGIARRGDVGRGLLHTAQAYGALAGGAAIATLVLIVVGRDPLGGVATYLAPGTLISYWTTISPTSAFVGLVAAIAGGIVITTNRAVLTAGVMVALALVPSAALVPVGLIVGDPAVAGAAFVRWLLDVGLVAFGSAIVIGAKRLAFHRRDSLA